MLAGSNHTPSSHRVRAALIEAIVGRLRRLPDAEPPLVMAVRSAADAPPALAG